jgi:hypothetical protein
VRSEALQRIEGLVGDWTLTMKNAWFIEDPEFVGAGTATIQWLGDAFLEVVGSLGTEQSTWHWVIGRSDARDQYVMLYYDERGVERLFEMTFGDGEWTLLREDPDFHQRFVGTVSAGRIDGRWEASEDAGKTWRKDFDLTWERRA